MVVMIVMIMLMMVVVMRGGRRHPFARSFSELKCRSVDAAILSDEKCTRSKINAWRQPAAARSARALPNRSSIATRLTVHAKIHCATRAKPFFVPAWPLGIAASDFPGDVVQCSVRRNAQKRVQHILFYLIR